MDQLEHPDPRTWEKRSRWFDDVFDIERRGGGYIIGEQATGLLVDLQACFSAGAFISCIILSAAIVDAHLIEVEWGEGFSGGMKKSFTASRFVEELEWLRTRRNRLVHFRHSDELPISVDSQWSDRERHELEAVRAIKLVADVLYENPFS